MEKVTILAMMKIQRTKQHKENTRKALENLSKQPIPSLKEVLKQQEKNSKD